jgi:biopolymer transport protein ExbD
MAGVDLRTGRSSGRREVNGEINMVPMIDLLVSCIAFLLITAVWSHMARVSTSAEHPGTESPHPITPKPPEAVLHVDARGEGVFALSWCQGKTVVTSLEVPRRALEIDKGAALRFPDLATAITNEWTRSGSHRDPADREADVAVLHANNRLPFRELVAIIDAVHAVERNRSTGKPAPAFTVAFATD